eukprot:6204760-Pleurochrysis_carterae.AAC.4
MVRALAKACDAKSLRGGYNCARLNAKESSVAFERARSQGSHLKRRGMRENYLPCAKAERFKSSPSHAFAALRCGSQQRNKSAAKSVAEEKLSCSRVTDQAGVHARLKSLSETQTQKQGGEPGRGMGARTRGGRNGAGGAFAKVGRFFLRNCYGTIKHYRPPSPVFSSDFVTSSIAFVPLEAICT